MTEPPDVNTPPLDPGLATLIARHLKAALLHLNTAADAARAAGLNLDGTLPKTELTPPPGLVFTVTPACDGQHLAKPDQLIPFTPVSLGGATIGASGFSLCGFHVYDQAAIDAQDDYPTRSRTRFLAELAPLPTVLESNHPSGLNP